MPSFVECRNVTKTYHVGEVTIPAANGIDFSIEEGRIRQSSFDPAERARRPSSIFSEDMDRPASGEILVDGTDIATLSHKQLIAYRRNDIGFVFQFYNLVQNLTALENVELALRISQDRTACRSGSARRRPRRPPGELSGTAFRRRTAACLNCPRTGEESEAPALRRADRRTGLYDRQSDSEAPAGHLPIPEDDHYRNHA